MVREANMKQATAEKQLKEALGKVRNSGCTVCMSGGDGVGMLTCAHCSFLYSSPKRSCVLRDISMNIFLKLFSQKK